LKGHSIDKAEEKGKNGKKGRGYHFEEGGRLRTCRR